MGWLGRRRWWRSMLWRYLYHDLTRTRYLYHTLTRTRYNHHDVTVAEYAVEVRAPPAGWKGGGVDAHTLLGSGMEGLGVLDAQTLLGITLGLAVNRRPRQIRFATLCVILICCVDDIAQPFRTTPRNEPLTSIGFTIRFYPHNPDLSTPNREP